MIELFNKFPRELAIPERFKVENLKEFLNQINKYNGRRRIFTSIYEYPNPKVSSIFFDLDNDKGFENLKKMHAWCMKNDYKHFMFFSGKGFHVYLLTKNYHSLKDPKQTLYNSHKFIASSKETDLTIGEGKKFDIDWHIIGDIRRVATVPGTFNMKRNRYCVCVLEEDLKGTYEEIKEKGKKPNLVYECYGNKFFDVKPFDKKIKEFTQPLPYEEKEVVKIDKKEAMKNLPKCIKVWISKEHMGWKRRGWVICWLRDRGLWREKLNEPLPATYDEALSLLKESMSRKEFNHMHSRADGWQVSYLYFRNTKNSAPNCENIKAQGECPLEQDEFCKEKALFRF